MTYNPNGAATCPSTFDYCSLNCKVIFADWLRGFGLLTILDHGSDYMTLYGHADVLYKNVGDWVESGEVIAGAGNSGGKQDTGIYFEVRHKGQPKDPIGWVVR